MLGDSEKRIYLESEQNTLEASETRESKNKLKDF